MTDTDEKECDDFAAGRAMAKDLRKLRENFEPARMPSTPPSLLVVSTTLNEGGAQRFTSTLLQHLDRDLIRPSLCVLRDEIGYPLPGDVPLHVLDNRRFWHLPRTVRRLRRLLERLQPDVLLSNVNATNLVAGRALYGCRHQPAWVARIGVSPAYYDGIIRTAIARRTYPRADRFVVNSAGLIEGMIEAYPFSEGRIDRIANPTDFDQIDRQACAPPPLTHDSDAPLLIAVGRLYKGKRYDVMIDAFARVVESHRAVLWICGDGPCRDQLQAKIRHLHLEHSVKLLGFCDNPYALLRQGALFVMSSASEGLPNALIEAQGLGLPAVAARCPYGPEEIIEDGRTGVLVPVGESGPLADAIREMLDDPARRQRMAETAKASARRRFAAAPLTRAWEDLLLRQVALRDSLGTVERLRR